MVLTNSNASLDELYISHSFHTGEFGIVYKAHIVKNKNGQVITETMAVKTLKGEQAR